MKQIFTLITTLFTLAILFGMAQPTTPNSPSSPTKQPENKKEVAEVGEKAPEFALKDQHGRMHKLADYKGKVVVLEWFNETCPYCKQVWDSGLIGQLNVDLKNLCQNSDSQALPSVVYLAINSTANRPAKDVLKSGAEFIEEARLQIPMLLDYDGKVGKSYGARTTPHMFVIDPDGILVYQGALSDDRRGKEGKEAETHVERAVRQLIKGEKISPDYVKPWGCGVKYGGDKGRNGRPGRGGRPSR